MRSAYSWRTEARQGSERLPQAERQHDPPLHLLLQPIAAYLYPVNVSPRVSVVIPAYQAEAFLGETLAALQAQTLADWEAWVVDDGSTDGTAALTQALARTDGRIHLLQQPNQGPAAARNLGLNRCQAPYVLFLDSDDLLLPHALASLTAILDADPQAMAVYGRYQIFGTGIEPQAPAFNTTGTFLHRMLACVPQGLHISAFLVRRPAVEAIGGWDAGLVVCEDWDLWVRLVQCYPDGIRAVAKPVVRIRRHAGQLSRQVALMEYNMRKAQQKAYRNGAYHSRSYYRRCRSIFALVLAASYIRDAGRWGAGLRCALEALVWHPVPVLKRLAGLIGGGGAGL